MIAGAELRVALKQRGLRMTPQRQLVIDVVGSLQGHISVDQVHQQVTSQFPDVHITTVYRTLEVLAGLGIVRHTHFHDGVAQYQRADELPRHHMVCTFCLLDTELDMEILQPLAAELKQRYGFNANLAHTAIVGVCRDCHSLHGDGGGGGVGQTPAGPISRRGR